MLQCSINHAPGSRRGTRPRAGTRVRTRVGMSESATAADENRPAARRTPPGRAENSTSAPGYDMTAAMLSCAMLPRAAPG
ncbi:hypothetical protein ACXR8U_21245 [Methylobacterium radiotolerans]|jgi:hypothetical protein|uniref:hypothetical protein n=1 Tax=Methylobacterium radiotolerans TaxID=31998 RepID=UPI00117F5BCF|nr:hypothetical protein [Methylobacterium radiotolerans]MBN6821036.1 hypothetical protein [Methylobacterium organophilum]